MKSIVFIIPYFGRFPEWSDLYFETVRRNSTIKFVFYTDCDFSKYQYINNVVFKSISFNDYVAYVKSKINYTFNPENAYKLCDLRPMYPIIHWDDIKESDFFGWTDMDILYGDIRSFYTNDILSRYHVLSTHEIRVSGHMAIFKNISKYVKLHSKIYDFQRKLAHPTFIGIDEHGVTNALTMTIVDKFNEKFKTNFQNLLFTAYKKYKNRQLYLREQYTTPFINVPWIDATLNSQHPDTWFYKDGEISNTRDGNRKFIYLHMMNFINSRYRHDSTPAPWEGMKRIVFASVDDMKTGIVISKHGIHPLNQWHNG